jgi:hypothetical protein
VIRFGAVLALILQAGTTPARAGDELRKILFSSLDAGRTSVFSGFGSKRAIDGTLGETGPIIMNLNGTGLTRQLIRTTRLTGTTARQSGSTAMLGGYQVVGARTTIFAALGPEVERAQHAGVGGIPRWAGYQWGARFLGEIWHWPNPDTVFSATLVISTARPSAWARTALGLRVADQIFAGPEVVTYAEEHYREARLGVHVGGIAVGPLEFRFSGGLCVVADQRGGGYATVTTLLKL